MGDADASDAAGGWFDSGVDTGCCDVSPDGPDAVEDDRGLIKNATTTATSKLVNNEVHMFKWSVSSISIEAALRGQGRMRVTISIEAALRGKGKVKGQITKAAAKATSSFHRLLGPYSFAR